MPNIANQNSRLAWLCARLANRRNHIFDLVRRLTGIGPAGAMKPSLFAKFLRMLDDVGAAVREETLLLGRIEDIEQKHRLLRAGNKLKQAAPKSKTATVVFQNETEKQPERAPNRLLWLIILWYLFVRQKINHKKQGLTAD